MDNGDTKDMELNFLVSEEEFAIVFGMLYGMSQSAHMADDHRKLAWKLFCQAVPKARELAGDEYESFMDKVEAQRKEIDGRDIMVIEKIPGAKDNN